MGTSGLFALLEAPLARSLGAQERLDLEMELRRAVERAVPDGLAAFDSKGVLLYANPAFCRMVEFSAQELLGTRPPFPFWDGTERDLQEGILNQLSKGELDGQSFRLPFSKKSGGRFLGLVRSARLRLPEGLSQSYATVVSVGDLAEQERLDQALQRHQRIYRAIGESIDYGIWICDAEGRNTYASPSFLELVGLTQEECSEFGWSRVLHPDEAEATKAAWKQCVAEGGNWERQHRCLGVDGKWHHVLARGVPIRDEQGAITCWAGINLDIQELNDAQERIVESERRKDEFIAVLAHELRNPLAPVRSCLELLQKSPEQATLAKTLPILERQVRHVTRLVDDLLEATRIRKGTFELNLEPTQLQEVVQAAIDALAPQMAASGHRLQLSLPEHPVVLEADPVRLTQAVTNVLDNAVKYTNPGGTIRLRAWLEPTEPGSESTPLTISISDTGIGVPPDKLEDIFSMLTQLEPPPGQARAGLGIGLHLVRSITALHGGRVVASSAGPGRGLRIDMHLPARLVPVRQSVPPPVIERNVSFRVLLVDDNRDAADVLAELLRALGQQVLVAYGGEQALKLLRNNEFDVAMLDLGMPGMDGLELARRIRSEQDQRTGLKELKLIAITGWGRPEDRDSTREAGFHGHLAKPVEAVELFALIDSLTP